MNIKVNTKDKTVNFFLKRVQMLKERIIKKIKPQTRFTVEYNSADL